MMKAIHAPDLPPIERLEPALAAIVRYSNDSRLASIPGRIVTGHYNYIGRSPMPTPTVDLRQAPLLSEIVMRGGDIAHPAARNGLKTQYARPNVHFPDVQAGLSCLFRPGASLDELAQEGSYRNATLSVTI